MTCIEIQERLSAAIDGEAFVEEVAAETAAHLEGCVACAQAVRELSSVHRLLLEDRAQELLTPIVVRRVSWGRRVGWAVAGFMAVAVLWAVVWPSRRPEATPAPKVAESFEEPRNVLPTPPPPAPEKSVAAPVGSLVRFEGEAVVLSGARETPARPGQELTAGQGVQTIGQGSWAWVERLDGTKFALGPETRLVRLSEGSAAAFFLERGLVEVHAERPMTIATRQAEVAILGTQLTVAAEPEATLVRVVKGRVRLTRLRDGASVEVPPGHFATTMAQGGLESWQAGDMPSEGLVLWLRLEEGRGAVATDASGRGNHGVLKGAGISWSAGQDGGALAISGGDSYVKIAGSASLCPVSKAAVGARVNLGPGRSARIATLGDAVVLQVLADGNVSFSFGGDTVTTAGIDVADGIWHHVLGQRSARALEVFVDGVLSGSLAAAEEAVLEYPSWPDLCLGQGEICIEEVHLHVRALAPDEIRNVARVGR